ncbi:MAG: peptidylprolyl isomerase [Dehalococcoidales bacterium]|nr:peptidylprolyl isomerase [Dehalococcoidales bacterium]
MAKKKKTEKPKREYTRRQLSSLQKQRRRQRIIFFGGIAVITAVVLIVVIGWLIGDYIPMHKTVLEVNDTKFNTGQYIELLKMIKEGQPDSDIGMLGQTTMQEMQRIEVTRQKAAELGITVSEEEILERLEGVGLPATYGYKTTLESQLIESKLKVDYFGSQVPESAEQVHARAMLLESESLASKVRGQLLSGDNYTALVEEYALDYYAMNMNQGDYGWHPREIYEVQLGSAVAIDYAFSAEPGVWSEPLFDEEKSKQLGYWLIRVNDMPEEASANVSAVFLSSEDEAREIKARLEAGEALGPIADEYSNYSPSRDKHGELGYTLPEQISEPFDNYVFAVETELGKWSDPIRDDKYWSTGGYWLVEAVDREEDRVIDSEDRNYLVDQLYSNWVNGLFSDPFLVIDDSGLTDDLNQWAMERALKELEQAGG